jgi:hypothetical protein
MKRNKKKQDDPQGYKGKFPAPDVTNVFAIPGFPG